MLTVVKLGGSLLSAGALPACLDAAGRYAGNVVIVPGGGRFADQVRSAQSEWRFDDRTAHRMAILAMQQMALLFQALKADFSLLRRASELPLTPTAIWLPDPDELDAAGIAASWDITSDSLAAWLAWRTRADQLLLVKSCPLDPHASLSELQRRGVVDAGIQAFSNQADFKIRVVNKDLFVKQ